MSKFYETAKKDSSFCLFFPYSITAAVSFLNTQEKIANLSTKQLFFSSIKIGLVEF